MIQARRSNNRRHTTVRNSMQTTGIPKAGDTTNGCNAVQDEDSDDAPTADGSSEHSRNKGLEHQDWVESIEKWSRKHPFQDRDLRVGSIYLSKFLDTRPLDEVYISFHQPGGDASLGVGGRLIERIIA